MAEVNRDIVAEESEAGAAGAAVLVHPAADRRKLTDLAAEDPSQLLAEQVNLLRYVLATVGSKLNETSRVGASFFSLPDVLDAPAASRASIQLSGMVDSLAQAGARLGKGPEEEDSLSDADGEGEARWGRLGAVSSTPTPASTSTSAWTPANDWMPTPPYSLHSPEVRHLLQSWTRDQAQIDYLLAWIDRLATPLPPLLPAFLDLSAITSIWTPAPSYPPGVQIAGLSGVLKEGFLVLLLPLVRDLAGGEMEVAVRTVTRGRGDSGSGGRGNSGKGGGNSGKGDAQEPDLLVLYDLRIRRLDIEPTSLPIPNEGSSSSARSSSGERLGEHPYRASSKGAPFKASAQDYYSPLAEIDSFLPGMRYAHYYLL
ncbi:hypothetical protein B484DRAFT_402257 [Ochromonadaceae sp. CCMP2298]|nr:hypothetical protein B484DRAFT_402257 [Ochromonadaceae sp. CCMP2298]